MSKTKGNVLDPTELTSEYGSDALRFALITAAPAGADLKLSADRMEANRNFVNKIWNATRYVLRALEDAEVAMSADGEILRPQQDLSLADRWILSRLDLTIGEVSRQLERFDLNEAARKLYDFVWSEYGDWYIESTKVALGGDEPRAKAAAQQTLAYVLDRSLRLLHPFIPFVTEELWHYLPHDGEALIAAPWPEAGERDEQAEREYGLLIEIVRAVRNARAEHGVPPARLVSAQISADGDAGALRAQSQVLSRLARLEPGQLSIEESIQELPAQAVSLVVGGGVQVYLPLAGLIDLDEERKRLQGELDAATAQVGRSRARLANPQFTERAPAHVVEGARAQLAAAEERARVLEARLRSLG